MPIEKVLQLSTYPYSKYFSFNYDCGRTEKFLTVHDSDGFYNNALKNTFLLKMINCKWFQPLLQLKGYKTLNIWNMKLSDHSPGP